MKKVIIFIITDIIVLAGFAIIKNSIHSPLPPAGIVAKIKLNKNKEVLWKRNQ